jgi:hypothetical protein
MKWRAEQLKSEIGVRNVKVRRALKDYFNCDRNPLSLVMYDGKHVGFFAVVDHIDDGFAFARSIPAQQFRGLDVFEGKPLPEIVVFVYPENTLVPKQEQAFVKLLIERYPATTHIIVITTSALILTDAVECEQILRLPPESEEPSGAG